MSSATPRARFGRGSKAIAVGRRRPGLWVLAGVVVAAAAATFAILAAASSGAQRHQVRAKATPMPSPEPLHVTLPLTERSVEATSAPAQSAAVPSPEAAKPSGDRRRPAATGESWQIDSPLPPGTALPSQ